MLFSAQSSRRGQARAAAVRAEAPGFLAGGRGPSPGSAGRGVACSLRCAGAGSSSRAPSAGPDVAVQAELCPGAAGQHWGLMAIVSSSSTTLSAVAACRAIAASSGVDCCCRNLGLWGFLGFFGCVFVFFFKPVDALTT